MRGRDYEWQASTGARLSNFKNELRGCGPFLHDDPRGEGRTLKEVAAFVSERLSPLEGVLSTSTHFMLKTYKRFGVLMHQSSSDERLTVTP